MILAAQHIREEIRITPFHENTIDPGSGMSFGLQPGGYDVRADQDLIIPSQGAVLASIIEHIEMPTDVMAVVADKSSWARKFTTAQNTWVQAGWRGYLTLELTNHSPDYVRIKRGMPIVQLIFMRMTAHTVQPYSGRYQDQAAGPQEAR